MMKDFVKWFKSKKVGFVYEEDVHECLLPSLEHYLKNTEKVGIYFCKTYDENGNVLKVSKGYYVRSKNPFKWQYKKTHGH